MIDPLSGGSMMSTLYISQQGCSVHLRREQFEVKLKDAIAQTVQIPLIEQVLVFGYSQITTQALRVCLNRHIPVLYLSRMGQCYGRLLPMEVRYRQLSRLQQEMPDPIRLSAARAIVRTKLNNSRVLLQRIGRSRPSSTLSTRIQQIADLLPAVESATSTQELHGFEGAGAAAYFAALGSGLTNNNFSFSGRSRRPPADPVNALLSFGYQLLWNHLYGLIEAQDLDPYEACLHEGSRKHAALASDLVEAFRAPIADSLMLYLVNRRIVNEDDFSARNGGCYLNDQGRKKYLRCFIARMEQDLGGGVEGLARPRWDLLMKDVKAYKQFVYDPTQGFQPYKIR